MNVLSRDRIAAIARFKSSKFKTTSFFLDTDQSRRSKKEILTDARALLRAGRADLAGLDASREAKASLEADFDAIEALLKTNGLPTAPGLAVYACSGAKFLEVVSLPEAPRDRILFDANPYIRPLSVILDESRNMIALILDRREARWYEISLDGIRALDSLTSDTPKKVKEGGYKGYDGKRIQRHVDLHRDWHFKEAAARTMEIFKKNHFEGLLLGCPENLCPTVESFFHTYVRERIKGRLKAKPSDPPDKVLKEALAVEKDLRLKDEEKTVQSFVSELEKGGRARSGLRETLRSLNAGEAQKLLVMRGFTASGKRCPFHGTLFVEEARCPVCQRKTEPVAHIVDEAIERALKTHGAVAHITPPSKLEHYGKIGVLARF